MAKILPSNNVLIKIALLISLILLAAVLLNTDFTKLVGVIRRIKLGFFFLAFATLLGELLLKALRLKILVAPHSTSSLKDSLIVSLVGLPLGLVTPARFGDLIKTDTLSRKMSLPLAKSLAIAVTEKLLDFFTLCLLAILGITILTLKGKTEKIFLYSLFFVIAAAILLLIFLNKKLIDKLLKIFGERVIPVKFKDLFNKTKGGLAEFYSEISTICEKKYFFLSATTLAFVLWFNRILRVFLVSLSFGLKINFFYLLLVIPLIDIIEIMPISLMGLGTREYAYIFLLSLVGISQEESLALSLFTFLLVVIPFSLAGYLTTIKEYGRRTSNTRE